MPGAGARVRRDRHRGGPRFAAQAPVRVLRHGASRRRPCLVDRQHTVVRRRADDGTERAVSPALRGNRRAVISRGSGRKGDPVAGDIAISLDALSRNAVQFGRPENEEMKRLLVHGLLHLAGMNHGEGRGGKMLAVQEKLLDTLQSERIYGGKLK